ncbi:hypothetical protein L1049_005888 [Liquidambar formosana]|uniref:Uncharacterized protein n=1 Tax=Liquidambar formosana TaxID=63359 RepID=A0AAP0WSE5_LIQFO
MASLKADKPAGSQPLGQVKKEPAKAPSSTPASKPAPKKVEQKPREPRKKATGGKPAAKN